MGRECDLLGRDVLDADPRIKEITDDMRGGAKVIKQVIGWQRGRRFIEAKTVNGAPFTGTRYHVWSFPGQECVVLTETDKVFKEWKVVRGGIDQVVDQCIQVDSVA